MSTITKKSWTVKVPKKKKLEPLDKEKMKKIPRMPVIEPSLTPRKKKKVIQASRHGSFVDSRRGA